MRPVDKGEAPDISFGKYQDAEPYLEERLGAYCSFCEFPISHVPEVEHRISKSKDGDFLAWENLLLSCKYCNTRKGVQVEGGNKEEYLWPDEDDTFHAFLYDTDVPGLNEDYLEKQGKDMKMRAKNLFNLIKLDNIPLHPKDKDRRYRMRNEARNNALECKRSWEKIKETDMKEEYLQTVEKLAKATGFFSVWVTVFQDDMEVKKRLITAFKGTREEYCLD